MMEDSNLLSGGTCSHGYHGCLLEAIQGVVCVHVQLLVQQSQLLLMLLYHLLLVLVPTQWSLINKRDNMHAYNVAWHALIQCFWVCFLYKKQNKIDI